MARKVKVALAAGEYAPGWPRIEALSRHTHHWLRDPCGLGPVPHWFICPGFHGEMSHGSFAERGYEYCGPCERQTAGMTPTEFRAELAALGFTQAAFARFLTGRGHPAADVARSVRRWAQIGPPGEVVVILSLVRHPLAS